MISNMEGMSWGMGLVGLLVLVLLVLGIAGAREIPYVRTRMRRSRSLALGTTKSLKGKSAVKTSTMGLSVPMLVVGSISYRPVGICKGYETPAGPITAGANKGFAVFKIESVDNTKYGSSFTFMPERLFVNQSPPVQAAGTALCIQIRDSHRPCALRAFRKPLSRRAKSSTSYCYHSPWRK
jgi:hypothetical protein